MSRAERTAPPPDVAEYLAGLPEERKALVAAARSLVVASLPDGYVEGLGNRMIGWVVPLARSGPTYNGQPLIYVALASQKNYVSLYLMGVYAGREEQFRERWAATGKKLDMGRSCVRFKRFEDLAVDVLAAEIASMSVDDYLAAVAAAKAG